MARNEHFQPELFPEGTFASVGPRMFHGSIHNLHWSPTPPPFEPRAGAPLHMGSLQAAKERVSSRHLTTARVGTFTEFAIDPATMVNTPDRPVSDNLANDYFHGEGGASVGENVPATYDDDYEDDLYANAYQGGLYYINEGEDVGSLSAVVRDGSTDASVLNRYQFAYRPKVLQETESERESYDTYVSGDTLPDGREALGEVHLEGPSQPRLYRMAKSGERISPNDGQWSWTERRYADPASDWNIRRVR